MERLDFNTYRQQHTCRSSKKPGLSPHPQTHLYCNGYLRKQTDIHRGKFKTQQPSKKTEKKKKKTQKLNVQKGLEVVLCSNIFLYDKRWTFLFLLWDILMFLPVDEVLRLQYGRNYQPVPKLSPLHEQLNSIKGGND